MRHDAHRQSIRFLRASIPIAIAWTTATLCMAQESGKAAAAFEVASIRQNVSGETPPLGVQSFVLPGGRLVARNITLRELIRDAYGYQRKPRRLVTGGPPLLDRMRFDIDAKAERSFGPQPVDGILPADAAAMLQKLLDERFNVLVRKEMAEEPIYALMLATKDGKLGKNLVTSPATCLAPFTVDSTPVDLSLPAEAAIRQTQERRCPFVLGGGRFEMGNVTTADIAMMLALFPVIDRVVVDRTGLTGTYDMKVRFQGAMQLSPNAAPVPRAITESEFPILPAAIQQQLGLKLEPARGVVERLVVERAETPTPN